MLTDDAPTEMVFVDRHGTEIDLGHAPTRAGALRYLEEEYCRRRCAWDDERWLLRQRDIEAEEAEGDIYPHYKVEDISDQVRAWCAADLDRREQAFREEHPDLWAQYRGGAQ